MASVAPVQIPIERQKSSQAAGRFDLSELPGALAGAASAVRLAKTRRGDEVLAGEDDADAVATLAPGQVLATYGRSESKWVLEHSRRRLGQADLLELLSYARQVVGVDQDGTVRVCLMGHAGQGPIHPIWAPEDEVTLTVQPGDVLLRLDDVSMDW